MPYPLSSRATVLYKPFIVELRSSSLSLHQQNTHGAMGQIHPMVRSPQSVALCSIFVVNAGVSIHRLRSKIDDDVREVAHTPVEHGI